MPPIKAALTDVVLFRLCHHNGLGLGARLMASEYARGLLGTIFCFFRHERPSSRANSISILLLQRLGSNSRETGFDTYPKSDEAEEGRFRDAAPRAPAEAT